MNEISRVTTTLMADYVCVCVCVGVARHIAPKVICVRAHFLQLQFASSSSGGNICKSLTQPKRVYKPTTKTTAITHIQLHCKHTHIHTRTHAHTLGRLSVNETQLTWRMIY